MRAYSIVIKNPKTGEIVKPASLAPLGLNATYASFDGNGINLPGALGIEIDAPVSAFATPTGPGAYLKIWGVSLAEIYQASDLNGLSIEVYAGMQKGLPLAKPKQYGLIFAGSINKAFGNWINTEMSLDLIDVADMGSPDAPKNIVLDWAQGQTLEAALTTTLANAFPGYTSTFSISADLVAPESIVGYYSSMVDLAKDVLAASLYIINDPTYTGVQIFQQQGAFSIYDGTTPTTPTILAFEDLIGQPTWIDTGTVQFKTVMRADLVLNDYVSFPTVAATQTAGGAPAFNSGLKNKSAFSGTYQITDIHHFGNFRQPDAASWNTTFNAIPAQAQANAASAPVSL